ncbi:MAG: hypothetical protein ACK5L5_09475 [Bacteroidales bacterium]
MNDVVITEYNRDTVYWTGIDTQTKEPVSIYAGDINTNQGSNIINFN